MRVWSLLLAVILTFALTSCGRGAENGRPAVTSEETVMTALEPAEQMPPEEEPNPMELLDIQLEKDLSVAQSHYDHYMAYYNCGDGMKAIADEYYVKLMNYDGISKYNDMFYSSEEFHAFISDMKKSWDEFSEFQLDNYDDIATAIFQSGTASNDAKASHYYRMMKYWATEMYTIGQMTGVDYDFSY